jgi:glycosyltransferase involved in cell wall biosynthesis
MGMRAEKKRRIAYIYYSRPSTFIKNDYDTLSRHFRVEGVSYTGKRDAFKIIAAVSRSDLSFSWFAGGHAFLAVLFSRLLKKRSVVVVGGYDVASVPEIKYGIFASSWNRRIYATFALKHADRVLVVDPSLKGDAMKNAGIDGKNIEYLPTGYDFEKFRPEGTKEDLAITVSHISDIFIKRKGLETFVRAAARLPEKEFAVIGRPLDRSIEYLKGIAGGNVTFPGFVPEGELLKYYQRAKVYCQLSLYEGLPNALCEAMLCQCIPVGTERNGIPTAIGDTGFYVPYGDPESTARAIERGFNAPGDLGKRARERIKAMFPAERRERELAKLIEELC